MNKSQIEANPKSVRTLLSNVKYTIDTYQREYNWKSKQIAELLDDLKGRFLETYKEGDERVHVENYPHYFLGSIIVSTGSGVLLIVDGQQRLISLTLLLIYLNNLQQEQQRKDLVDVQNLIFSEKYSRKSFNINIPGLTKYIDAIYHAQPCNVSGQSEMVLNIMERYRDIAEMFPGELKGHALPYFIDWLIDNVDLVQITTHSDEEANIIFETMNDRGLNLSPADRLKSFLLSKISSIQERNEANELWKKRVLELKAVERSEVGFFIAWLFAQYYNWSIENDPKFYEQVIFNFRSTFHKWVREEAIHIGLRTSNDYRNLIMKNLDFFINQYLRLSEASQRFTPGWECVFYSSNFGSNWALPIPTIYPIYIIYAMLLAPICPEDDLDTVDRKIRLMAGYIDIMNAHKIVNHRSSPNNPAQSLKFDLIMETRGLDVKALAIFLKKKVIDLPLTFEGIHHLYLTSTNRRHIHYLLARITAHIEKKCGIESSFEAYYSPEIDKPFEIEHIWARQYHRHMNEFPQREQFEIYRNRIGGLVLLPRGYNQSFNDAPYEVKLEFYFGQNLLVRSLNQLCYQKNPSFLDYIRHTGLPFKPYPTEFKKADLDERAELYRRICEDIWSTAIFDVELEEEHD